MNEDCNINEINDYIKRIRQKDSAFRNDVCENIKKSFPAFILANFQVSDDVFYGITNPKFKSEGITDCICKGILENKMNISIHASELRNPNKRALNFIYTQKHNSIEISWNYTNL